MLCKLPKLYISNDRKNFERSTVSTYGQMKKTMKDFEKASHPLGQDLNSQLLDCEAGPLFTQPQCSFLQMRTNCHFQTDTQK